MIRLLPAIISLVAAAAGWHYLFYSQSAQRLDGVEPSVTNARRSRLRRINGIALLLLAAGFYSGIQIDAPRHPLVFIGIWCAVLVLLVLTVSLAVVDLRLTSRIKRKT